MMLKNPRTVHLLLFCIIFVLISFFKSPLECYSFDYDFEIEIDIAPNILNIQSKGQVVTVHTDIKYVDVVGSTVYLEDIRINTWKADNRGYFVAKFLMSEIKNLPLIIDDYNTLQLVGLTTEDESFSGSAEILVVNNIPAGGQ